MKTILNRIAPFAVVLFLGGPAVAQEQPAPQAPAQQQGAAQADAPPAPPPAPPAPPPQEQQAPAPDQTQPSQEAPPPAAQWVYSYPTGQWIYSQDGWMWVPAGTMSSDVDGVPYAYIYTPGYGWNWYISPWGVGAYHYGVWVRHPWRPLGWHGGWVAGPHVFVRLGGHAGFRGRAVVRGGVGGGRVVVRGGGGGGRVVVRGGGGGHHR